MREVWLKKVEADKNKMIVLVQANVLTVGLEGKTGALQELPVRVIEMQSGKEAASSLRNEDVHSVISRWDLTDMKDGAFLKGLKSIKPGMPTVAFVKQGDKQQEIAARSLGVSAVLSLDSSDEYFKQIVSQVLGLGSPDYIKHITLVDEDSRSAGSLKS